MSWIAANIGLINLGMILALFWFAWERERHIRRLQDRLAEANTIMADQHLALCLANGDDPDEVAAEWVAKHKSERGIEQ
ncbi:hypothetical protein LCGC14_0334790 [marine sediment metagenome]|uniref:Uncharacterized protein n=1 Tax=marine sediment metagenome TaxID=412755 RepID=A0A0F9W2T5_9ZZZZ